MRNTPLKTVIYFIIGTFINLAMFSLSKYAGFPLWLDFTGSLYINSKCGVGFGIASVTAHTLFLAVLIDGPAAMWLFLPYTLACIVITFCLNESQRGKALDPFKVASLTVLSAFIMNFFAFIISSPIGRYTVYTTAFKSLSALMGRFFASFVLSGGITVAEVIPTLILLAAAFLFSPKNRGGLTFHK